MNKYVLLDGTNLAKFSALLLVIPQKKFNFAWLQKK